LERIFAEQREFKVAEMAYIISKSEACARSTMNRLATQGPPFLIKHQGGGAAPSHPDLGQNGAPVTRSNVRAYMKKKGMELSRELVDQTFETIWKEAETLGNWVALNPAKYRANNEWDLLGNNGCVVFKKKEAHE
jgi:hypothetical protein